MPKSATQKKKIDAEELEEDLAMLDEFEDSDSGFTSPIEEYTFIHEDWKPGSFWTFKVAYSDDDDTAVENLSRRVVIRNVDEKTLRNKSKAGENVKAYLLSKLEEEQVMPARRALLAHMSVAWGGPRFTLPSGYSIARDPETKKPIIHELAGQVARCTPEYIALLGATTTNVTFWHMNPIWTSGRSPEAEASFPEADTRVAEPGSDEGDGASATEDAVPEAA